MDFGLARKQKGRQVDGILVLDKPAGETSNRSLQRVKRLLDAAKAGHTGSLDPLATGVLPLCFGEATKVSQFLLDADKSYRATIRLGIKTASGDSQAPVISTSDTPVSLAQLEAGLAAFRGRITQVPSMYSALKHQGVPLYKLARKGTEVVRKVRHVTIHDLRLLEFRGTELEVEVDCTKGTYIRCIADDLGDRLGVGAHITALRRLKSGPFLLDQAMSMTALEAAASAGPQAIDQYLQPADLAVAHLPAVELPATAAASIRQGQLINAPDSLFAGTIRLYEGDRFFGIGEVLEDGRLGPIRLMKTQ